MKLPEDFERCEKCSSGWFEEKKFVLIDKNASPQWGRPRYLKIEYQVQCVGCGHIAHKFEDHGY